MKNTMLLVMLFVSFFVLTSGFANADEVSKVQIQRTTTLQYELSEPILIWEQRQLLKYTILSMLEKRSVPGVVVSVGESNVTLLVKESNGILHVHNFCVLQSIYNVLGKEPELLE